MSLCIALGRCDLGNFPLICPTKPWDDPATGQQAGLGGITNLQSDRTIRPADSRVGGARPGRGQLYTSNLTLATNYSSHFPPDQHSLNRFYPVILGSAVNAILVDSLINKLPGWGGSNQQHYLVLYCCTAKSSPRLGMGTPYFTLQIVKKGSKSR